MERRAAEVTGFCFSDRLCSFYDAAGTIDGAQDKASVDGAHKLRSPAPADAALALLADCGPDPVIGWFVARRGTPVSSSPRSPMEPQASGPRRPAESASLRCASRNRPRSCGLLRARRRCRQAWLLRSLGWGKQGRCCGTWGARRRPRCWRCCARSCLRTGVRSGEGGLVYNIFVSLRTPAQAASLVIRTRCDPRPAASTTASSKAALPARWCRCRLQWPMWG